ncbi:hypothetical protein [Proteus sp. fly-1067]|uniref:hypothetical protein n=1 Tax=Proteus sp. fly-1067 TaxID=3136674 RepID=UPI0032DB1D50
MLQPESKANELLEMLVDSMLTGKLNLLPLEVMRIKKEIDKLPDPIFKLYLKGTIGILTGKNLTESMSLCERAINMDKSSSFYWSNYIVTLRNFGFLKKHYEFIEETSHLMSFSPKRVGYELFMSGIFLLRTDLSEFAISTLDKMDISLSDIGLDDSNIATLNLIYENPEKIAKLKPMVSCLLDVVDKQYTGTILSSIKKYPDGTICYVFMADLSIDMVSTLNDRLFDKLYEKDLLSSDICVYIDSKE